MTSKRRKPTIDMVARQSEVSKTTISRFLNGKYEYMSEETRNRIQRVVDELNYRPNNFARSLKSNRSGLIGVVVADIASPFSSILVKGIGDLCNERGYQIITTNTDEDPQKERDYLESLVGGEMVEGLIVNTTGMNDDLLSQLGHQGIPIILADRAMEHLEFDTITNDNYSMTRNALKHVVDSGFEHVAFFTQQIGRNSARRTRFEAYLDFFEFEPNTAPFVYELDTNDSQGVRKAIEHFRQRTNGRPAAIFAVNGVVSLAVLRSIAELGLHMPRDIGLCGYDDWEWATLVPPGITSIEQPSYEVGVEAAKRVIARIKGLKAKPKLIELPSTLRVRGSTKLK
ncbi:LacI family DNA-binding transcriptional regulator [Alicyclobacillus dauci]|uniref:LacI family DNA-binding transcriptional regulator n=1 Tax=Alicyclobacillus dauci TaxID=1475485 RepID=A0ABY6YZI3_9BACL|nr:LacI family DNA-binding transcriptional regulator [Alicyclobacillus dauci]WAH36034.1 LacI family DNA-binding transcriptional regulator [Alicyclobacillus dauci]